jgi:hypothetical protein
LAQRGSDSKDESGTPYNLMDEKDEIPTKIPATGGFLNDTGVCVSVIIIVAVVSLYQLL